MSKYNQKTEPERVANNGAIAVKESSYGKLKRLVGMYMINDERTYFDGGTDILEEIVSLSAKLTPEQFKFLVENTRLVYGLRHTPLLLIVGALKSDSLRPVISTLDSRILNRPSDTMDLIALYKSRNNGRTIPNQIKKLVAKSLNNFDKYQFGKYGKNTSKEVNLKDVINLTHPKPKDENQAKLFNSVLKGTIESPMTWEVLLTTSEDKKTSWIELMDDNKLPALATIRNLRNMLDAGVPSKKIVKYINGLKSQWIFPFQIITAMMTISDDNVKNALQKYLKRMVKPEDKLSGMTYIVLDISGSMGEFIVGENAKKAFSMAYSLILSSKKCKVFLTSGNDYSEKHKTMLIETPSDIDEFLKEIEKGTSKLGYGGIFTAQAINWISDQNYGEKVKRVVVISDSQDCDYSSTRAEKIAKYMYVNNIASYSKVAYTDNVKPFDAEITTFSSRIVDFIKFYESENA